MTLQELLKSFGVSGQSDIPHAHWIAIRVTSCEPALPCGSQYFIDLNDGDFTLGFTREEFIRFRDDIAEGSRNALAGVEISPADMPDDATCIVCNQPVYGEDGGFETTLGWMHFKCDKEAESANP